MFSGNITNELYQKCLAGGLCEKHSKEFSSSEKPNEQGAGDVSANKDSLDPFELQRKALLFIRLRVCVPTLYNKSLSIESKTHPQTPQSRAFFKELEVDIKDSNDILLLDSVTVYFLCHFSKICCAGVLFSSEEKSSSELELQKMLNKKSLEKKDMAYFIPYLRENFNGANLQLIQVYYCRVLLFVRTVSSKLKLKDALDAQELELHSPSKDALQWISIGIEASKKCQRNEAIKAFESAIKYNPINAEALLHRANEYFALPKNEEAGIDFYILQMMDPSCTKLFVYLMDTLLRRNLYSEALVVAENGLQTCTDKLMLNYLVLKKEKCQSELGLKMKLQAVSEDPIKKEAPVTPEASVVKKDSHKVELKLEVKNELKQPAKEDKHKQPEPKITFSKKEIAELKTSMRNNLKKASETLAEGCGSSATNIYKTALDEINTNPQVYEFDESAIICIKYAHGVAYVKSGGFEDLQKSILIFKEIHKDHTVTFPAAYYGIGSALLKLHRFKDALYFLNIVREILEKGIHFKVYPWPGMVTVINETKSAHLKDLVDDLIIECEAPPPPNAICRHPECSFQTAIYYTDPDFKGFYTVQCSENCVMQYHPKCWKSLKDQKHFTDKDFIEKTCLTPDCKGIITKIGNISKEGNTNKLFVSAENKNIKQKKTKLEKKLDLKEEKKRKQRDSERKSESADTEITADENAVATESIKTLENSSDKHKISTEVKVKTAIESTSVTSSEVTYPPLTTLSVDAKPFLVLKKEKLINENIHKASRKTKESKKCKNIIGIDEFFETDGCSSNEYQNRINNLHQTNQCFVERQWFQDNYEEFSQMSNGVNVNPEAQKAETENPYCTFVEPYNGDIVNDCTRKNIYSFFENLLTIEGPLRIDDRRLLDELSHQSGEVNIMIAEFGGIAGFLKQSLDFAVVKKVYICMTCDVSRAYEMYGKDTTRVSMQDEDFLDDDESSILSYTYLDPHAREYVPSTNFGTLSENASPEKVERNSPKLISAISRLREPLAIDDKSNVNCPIEQNQTFPPSLQKVPAVTSYNEPSVSFDKSSLSDRNGVSSKKLDLCDVVRKCTEAVKVYYSDEFKDKQLYIDSCMKPYSIVEIPKRKSKCIQTENTEVEKVSQGTMKLDDELDEMTMFVQQLTNEKDDLLEGKGLLEQQLTSALDSLTKIQNKSSVEIASLKKELEDMQTELENQRKEIKSKKSELDTSQMLLQEKLQNAQENVSVQKSERDQFFIINQKLEKDLRQRENDLKEMQNQIVLTKKTSEIEKNSHEESFKLIEADKLKVTQRAKNAELHLLDLKKHEYLKRIDAKISEAAKGMKDIEDGLNKYGMNLNPTLKNNLDALHDQIRKYISVVGNIRLSFVSTIDQQINAVNNGASLEEIKPLELKELPVIPSWPCYPDQATPNPQLSSWASQMHMMSIALNKPQTPYNAAMTSTRAKVPHHLSGPNLMIASNVMHPNLLPNIPPAPVTTIPPLYMPPPPPSVTAVNPPLDKSSTNHSSAAQASKPPPGIGSSAPKSASTSIMPPPEVKLNLNIADIAEAKSNLNIAAVAEAKPNLNISAIAEAESTSKDLPVLARKSQSPDPRSLELDYTIKKSPSPDVLKATSSISSLNDSSTCSLSATAQKNIPPKTGYEKLVHRLSKKFPNYTQEELTSLIKEFRCNRKSGLSGMSVEEIVKSVSAKIVARATAASRLEDLRRQSQSASNRVLVNKKLTLEEFKEQVPPPPKKNPWGLSDSEALTKWSGNGMDEGCIICYEDMSSASAYKVDCGHTFHLKCIREWLNKKSDCPICRVHLLLPEDYPAL